MKLLVPVLLSLGLNFHAAWAGGEVGGDGERVREAIVSGLKIVQKAAANYPEQRNCFSCHHQGLPMLAMVEARRFGVAIDAELLQGQAVFTHDFYKERTAQIAQGEGVGGRGMTAAYSLWALDLAGRKREAVSDALSAYLLKRQEDDGRWQLQSHRPPLEESNAMTTFLAAYYLGQFAAPENQAAIGQAQAKALGWIAGSAEKSQEDVNAKLWAAADLGGETAAASVARLRAQILAAQQEDGGWGQLAGMKSDAYATGQTLYILRATGLAGEDPAIARGVGFLLSTQVPDGSWLVETRSKPVQKFFDNGDPHGKNQFISIAATSWAVAALARCGVAASPPPPAVHR